jgi:hypothetical protein
MLPRHGLVPEISITVDPTKRCYGFSTRLPGDAAALGHQFFRSIQEAMWDEPGEARTYPK